MTVPATTCKTAYATNGATIVFPTGWRFLANAHVRATWTPTGGVPLVLVEGVHYSLAGAALDADGTLTSISGALAVGALVIERIVPLTQLVDLRQQGSFAPPVHMGMMDKLAMVDQQLSARIAALEALASLTSVATFAAQLVTLDVTVSAVDVETTFVGGAVALLVAVAAGQSITGVIVARVVDLSGGDVSLEGVMVRKWTWAPGAPFGTLTFNFITGLQPGVTYRLSLLLTTL